MSTFWTLFGCLYLTVSTILGIMSLAYEKMEPAIFDPYRSNDFVKRSNLVTGVMLLGPLILFLVLVTRNGK